MELDVNKVLSEQDSPRDQDGYLDGRVADVLVGCRVNAEAGKVGYRNGVNTVCHGAELHELHTRFWSDTEFKFFKANGVSLHVLTVTAVLVKDELRSRTGVFQD
jgi:hypothetical protein